MLRPDDYPTASQRQQPTDERPFTGDRNRSRLSGLEIDQSDRMAVAVVVDQSALDQCGVVIGDTETRNGPDDLGLLMSPASSTPRLTTAFLPSEPRYS